MPLGTSTSEPGGWPISSSPFPPFLPQLSGRFGNRPSGSFQNHPPHSSHRSVGIVSTPALVHDADGCTDYGCGSSFLFLVAARWPVHTAELGHPHGCLSFYPQPLQV